MPHQSRLERIIHGVEERIEEWRKEDAARKMEAEANREMLWAEAAEREKMLAEAISDEEAPRESVAEGNKQHLVGSFHPQIALSRS